MLFRTLLCLSALALLAEPHLAGDEFVCPPCGVDCHELAYESEGNCSECGMELVPRSTVPHVAVLLYERADVATSTGPLGVFAASRGSIAYTVADTTDPLRLEDSLTVVPQYDFGSVPAPDVLIVPSGRSPVWEDELVLDWIRETAAEADHVIGVGTGNIALWKAGLVEDGPLPSSAFTARFAKDLGLEGRLDAETAVVKNGKVILARDAGAALDAALGVLLGVNGAEKRDRTAEMLGIPSER